VGNKRYRIIELQYANALNAISLMPMYSEEVYEV